MKKAQKGITLVALIITIVVLLILAAVAIGTVKNSDIIGYAKKAIGDYQVADEKEAIGIALSTWKLEKVNPNRTFKQVITEELGAKAESVEGSENGPLTVKFKSTGNTYKITNDGKVEPLNQTPAEVGLEIIPSPSSTEKAQLILRVYGSGLISEQEAINFANKELLGSDEVITLEELDVRLYNKMIEEDEELNGEKVQGFEELKTFFENEENMEFGNDPANEIFLVLTGVYDVQIFTNISDFVCYYRYASTSNGGLGETLEYKLTYNKDNGEFKEQEESVFVGYYYVENYLEPGIYITMSVEGDGEYSVKLEIGETVLTAKTTVEYVEPEAPIEGRYVKYDSDEDGNLDDEILYRVLYVDDDEDLGEGKGAHIITDEVLKADAIYLGAYNKEEGIADDTLPSDDEIPVLKEEKIVGSFTKRDLAADRTVYSYNNLFETLNNKCKEALNELSGDGNAMVDGITVRVRNILDEPLREQDTESYISYNNYDKAIKIGHRSDIMYNSQYLSIGKDYSRLSSTKILKASNNKAYWTSFRASYFLDSLKNYPFGVWCISSEGEKYYNYFASANLEIGENIKTPLGVRPIVVLEHGVLKNAIDNKQGTGTLEDPHILTKIHK